MISLLNFLISSILPITVPFNFITPILIVYFLRRRNQLLARIKDIPNHQSNTPINLQNEIKNFKLKLLVCHFILLLLIIELKTNLMESLAYLPTFLVLSNQTRVELTNSCWIEHNHKLKEFIGLGEWIRAILPFSLVNALGLMIMPIVTILLKILANAFFNFSYKGIAKKWLIVTFVRTLIVFAMTATRWTHYYSNIVIGFSVVIDYICFLKASRRFYIVLKSRKIEARWHSTEIDYNEKQNVFYQFVLSNSYTGVTFLIFTIWNVVNSFNSIFYFFLVSNNCVIRHFTFGLINLDLTAAQKLYLVNNVYHSIDYVRFFLEDLYQLFIFVAYFLIILALLISLLRRRRFYNRVYINLVKPLMDRYKRSIYGY